MSSDTPAALEQRVDALEVSVGGLQTAVFTDQHDARLEALEARSAGSGSSFVGGMLGAAATVAIMMGLHWGLEQLHTHKQRKARQLRAPTQQTP